MILAVKPQQMKTGARRKSAASIRADAIVVSIAAGVTIARLAAGLAPGQRIVRVMPNTPCLIGQGASGYSLGPTATADDGKLVAQLLSAVGVAFEVPEAQLDAVTGLSGSGPAFVYTMIELLAAGGRRWRLAGRVGRPRWPPTRPPEPPKWSSPPAKRRPCSAIA